jgi:hypothetical protein
MVAGLSVHMHHRPARHHTRTRTPRQRGRVHFSYWFIRMFLLQYVRVYVLALLFVCACNVRSRNELEQVFHNDVGTRCAGR